MGRLDAHDQAALVKTGELTPADLVDAAILRIEHLDAALNVMTFKDYDRARARARATDMRGAMAGVPWLLKDGLDYPGMPNRSGSRSKRDAAPGTIEFPFTRAFDDAGLIPLGKTNAPEFGLLPTTEPLLYGAARNPWSLDRSPGGSSGGAAAAVASGMVPVAHAADGGGSIRIPASCCGLVGLKPGRGANVRARDPHVLEDLLACDVLLSRSVRDVSWAYATAAGGIDMPVAPVARRLRVAVIADTLDGAAPSPQVAAVLRQAADLCASLGHDVVAAPLPADGPGVAACFRTLWRYLARDAVAHVVSRMGEAAAEAALEPWTRDLARHGETLGTADLEGALGQICAASDAFARFFTQYDIVLSPVLRHPALAIGDLAPDRSFEHIMERMFDYVSYTPLQNLTGLPALSLPLYLGADGVPIGSMFTAARGQEALLLELAFELEAALPWKHRWPAHSIGTEVPR
ncbi:hypothetical protein TS85_04325 [Sphingomonas hengshuiensis]|uniref:Amidase domain-containing protein n=1 Tax=Sphingomonas hengshuiensis TaxID=1609977 RepID=A0A7U5CUV8_9SPHN|nr:hypothetical protein TS85_04325 [Sphingomonas hengshuiensis]